MDKSSKKVLRAAFEAALPRERQTSAGREVYFTKDEYESAFEGFAAGYAAGAADMKERGAKECSDLEDDYLESPDDLTEAASACGACAAIIRALPITPTNPVEGEQA